MGLLWRTQHGVGSGGDLEQTGTLGHTPHGPARLLD
jgi:hypothetical protein